MATIHKPFKYVPALHTDIQATFKRERARLRAQEAKAKAEDDKRKVEEALLATKVTPLPVTGRRHG